MTFTDSDRAAARRAADGEHTPRWLQLYVVGVLIIFALAVLFGIFA